MADYILSCDIGTSSCKTVLFDSNLKTIASASAAYPTDYPADGWAEQNADDWWQAVISTTREILQASAVNPVDIVGIGVDAMSSMSLPVSKTGQPLRKGPLWSDRRAAKEAEELKTLTGDAALAITMNRFDAASFAAKIAWFKRWEPDTYQQAAFFLHCNGYIVFRLTGSLTTDVSQCGLSNLCNTSTSSWSDEICRAAGIDRAKLPDLYECSQVVGKVTEEAARITGLAAGTPVVAGAMDNTAAVLGLGLNRHGQAYISAGTATNTGVCISSPANVDNALLLYRSAMPGLWLVNGGVDFGGAGMRWLQNITGLPYQEIDRIAAESRPFEPNPLFLPYMTQQRAPLWDQTSRGAFLGIDPNTGHRQLIRSVMESIAFGIRWIFEMIEEKGFTLSDIRMTGGCANSPPWLDIFANIIGLPVLVPGEQDASTLGTAVLVGVGTGLFSSFDEALTHITIREQHFPSENPRLSSYYDEVFALYKRFYQRSREDLENLAEIRRTYGETDESSRSV